MSFLRKLLLGIALLLALPSLTQAEDIDVFVGGTGASGGMPNVLIVLENTSNWSRQAQDWPGGVTQGQSEVRAIKAALSGLENKVNVGLVEFTTQGNDNQDGGFVRFDLQPLNSSSKSIFDAKLDYIFNNIESPQEKRSGAAYGNLISDVYNYLAGRGATHSGAGTPSSADIHGYETLPSRFASPLTSENSCVKTYVIFIGNPNQSGPDNDSYTNSTALASRYAEVAAELEVSNLAPDKLVGGSGAPLPIPKFTTQVIPDVTYKDWTTGQCYADVAACTADQSLQGKQCYGVESCACSSASADSRNASCKKVQSTQYKEYRVVVDKTRTEVVSTGEYDTVSGADWNFDDWAKFLFQYGVPVPGTGTPPYRMPVVTYTIDVFNKQQNSEHTGLMLSAAKVGGGKYFAARNEEAIKKAIETAMSEILSASSTFAAVALPLSATNRAQNENQVFIGMFRPDQYAKPQWFGNLKRYKIGLVGGEPELVDAESDPVVNTLTNFPSECAKSFWSIDSGVFWQNKDVTPAPLSKCLTAISSPWSDLPDGPFVEKGGAAQALRNFPDMDSPNIAARKVLTVGDSGVLSDFNSTFATAVGGQSVLDHIRGKQTVNGVTSARSTIHGDVVHSRPLPINYGSADSISVFYGANDGLLHAIDSSTGMERWSMVAPEHFGKLKRLYEDLPLVAFPNQDMSATPKPQPKDYFFDGAIGQFVLYDEDNTVSKAFIYPSMRRGGRMIYALDVTDPDEPSLLWRKGCQSLVDDLKCEEGFADIGQTWSMPKSAYLAGYEGGDDPVVIFGGGYDACEDADSSVTKCGDGAKGRAVYVLDAETGELLQKLVPASGVTMGSVSADVSLVDVDYDGKTDYAYTVDLSGNVWRISFRNPTTGAALAKGSWKITKIAYTDGGARKFLNAPAVLPYKGSVYLAFGSGNRERPLEVNYPYVTDVDDRYYVFLDNPANDTAYDLDDDGTMHDYTADTSCDAESIVPSDNPKAKRGWFMSLPGRGEQVVTTSVIAAGWVAFNTYKPGGASEGMCARPLGVPTSYKMNLFNASGAIGVSGVCGGKRSVEIPGGGIPIAPTLGTVEVSDPNCTSANCPKVVKTICIGCAEGLNPDPVVPHTDQTRSRTYWSSDIDR